MPITYQFSADKRTIRTTCTGHLTLPEIIEHFQALERDPECPAQLDVFLDCSEVTSLPETRQISAVVTQLKRVQPRVRFDACAIVASHHALFGMMRMFEALAEEVFRVTRTFPSASEAEAWLALQQKPGETKSADGT
ncbi:MAG TPA: STAS/SEC14 domain-containing protein [Terriglobales bacterium]|nr:STAS/SEC14 domain-containing protein [Terriglobales bacterium]